MGDLSMAGDLVVGGVLQELHLKYDESSRRCLIRAGQQETCQPKGPIALVL